MTTTSAPSSAPAPPANNRYHLIERIVTAVVGAVILALQGINVGESASNGELIRRVETALSQQMQLIRGFEQEGARIDRALENQDKMIDRLDRTLEILDKSKPEH